MSLATCSATDHRFAKFDDATIFCQRCGEQRVMDVQALIAQLPQPIYLPCPGHHYSPPSYPWWGTTTAVPYVGPNTTITYTNLTNGTADTGSMTTRRIG